MWKGFSLYIQILSTSFNSAFTWISFDHCIHPSIHLGTDSHGQLVLGKGPEEKRFKKTLSNNKGDPRWPCPEEAQGSYIGARQGWAHHWTRARACLSRHPVDPPSIGRIAVVRWTAKRMVVKARGYDEPDAGGRWSIQLNYLYIQTPLWLNLKKPWYVIYEKVRRTKKFADF